MVRGARFGGSGYLPYALQRLYEQGLLLRSGRGVYLPAEAI